MTHTIIVPIRRIGSAGDLPMPDYMSPGASGVDLYAAVNHDEVLDPGTRKLIPTGIEIALPDGFEAQIRPRSGLAIHNGVTLLNSPGTIDADYRGEIKIILINLGTEPFVIKRGDRIAQMVVHSICRVSWREVDELKKTLRNDGGFGHTG
ncbi:MAG: dUTP diphosphatase [Syntrophales bacterium]|nr:dUTP diphosphatase [Syntrophales bacterium]